MADAPDRRISAAQPGDDLLQAERLGDVVVAAGREPGDAVLDGVAGGEEEDGYVGRGARSRRSTSMPSKSGSIMSSTTASGLVALAVLTALLPVSATSTSQPS